ncbi:HK97 family phage prohead protease [Mycolicibacterium canariasense]|uniref:HK97 family phage prohead protease n=1 Tax=Mycolicibacterium canariasense TaxID=228230 RepID=UPI0032D57C9F
MEVRAGSNNKMTIGGYAAKFNRMSQNLGGFVEQIDNRAFNKSAGDGWPDVIARYNHDDNFVLGTTNAGTLRCTIDGVGLLYDVDLPSSRADVFELVQRNDVSKSSFAFITIEDDWGTNDQGFPVRTLVATKLIDVAPVNTPAYLDTSTGLRSLARKFDAPVEEVRKLAEDGDLGRFFRRTDKSPSAPRRSAHLALGKALNLNIDQRL